MCHSKESKDWIDRLNLLPIPSGVESIIVRLEGESSSPVYKRQLDALSQFAEHSNLKILVISDMDFEFISDEDLALFGVQRIPK